MTKIVITGSKGRMGKTLIACAAGSPDLRIVGEIDQDDDLHSVIQKADVIVDFSFHDATVSICQLCAREKKALVIGTTGHSAAERDAILVHCSSIPIVWASNYSTGVNALFWLTRKAAQILGPGFDLEIMEMHHRLKKDAPSGTAATLAQILTEVRQKQLGKAIQPKHGRQGITGERTVTEI